MHDDDMTNKTLKWVVVLLLVWVYMRYAMKVRPEMLMLQTSITHDRMHELLAEKHPVIIDESIPNIKDMLKTTFKYQYIMSRTSQSPPYYDAAKREAPWRRCNARYTLLHVRSASNAFFIDVKHPKMKYDIVRVNVRDSCVMILPPRYWYRPVAHAHAPTADMQKPEIKSSLHIVELYDVIHTVMMPVIGITTRIFSK